MPKKYTMEVTRSAGSKESTAVSAKLRDDILQEHFGYKDIDVADVTTEYPERSLIKITGDKVTTDYEWENDYIPKYGIKITVTLTDEEVKFYTEFLNNRRLIFIEIEEFPGSPIGQIGFLGNKAVIIVSYLDEYDLNKDGSFGWDEWFASFVDMSGLLKNEQFTKVAMTARVNPKVLNIDSGFHQKANNIYLSFASGLMISGIYDVYLSQAVTSAASLVGKRVIGDSLKRKYLIEKGAEEAVEEALKKIYQ
jgi:hypothetical protein